MTLMSIYVRLYNLNWNEKPRLNLLKILLTTDYWLQISLINPEYRINSYKIYFKIGFIILLVEWNLSNRSEDF